MFWGCSNKLKMTLVYTILYIWLLFINPAYTLIQVGGAAP